MTDGSSAGGLRFEILGPVRAFRGSEPIDLGPVKQQAVLALLLLHAGQPVPIERIVGALWGGDPPENGIDVVQRYVGGLRRALDPGRTSLITLTPGGYLIRESVVDAEEFRAALAQARTGAPGPATGAVRRALTRWRDEPLAGLTGVVFESARVRLNEERARASELLAPPAPARAEPAPTRAMPTPPAPARAEPAPTRAMPAHHAPARAEPTRVESPRPTPDPAEPSPAKPAYPEAVDPWAGHELFPPD